MRIFIGLILFSLVWGKNIPTHSPQKPIVLVSIAPYQFLVQRIAGDALAVQTVVPPSTNPHIYEPTAKQVASLSQGTVWFRVGEPFEDKVLAVLQERNPALVATDLREGIDLLGDTPDAYKDHQDRHIWLSPKLAAQQAERIAHILADQFPEDREKFFTNANTLTTELEQLDQEIASLLDSVTDRILLVSHPAFGYFCRDYHFEQLSVEFEGKDPRPRHLNEILQKAIETHADLALGLPQHNNKGAQIIADKLHVPIRMIDPYSPKYFETLRLLAHMIADPQYQP